MAQSLLSYRMCAAIISPAVMCFNLMFCREGQILFLIKIALPLPPQLRRV